MFGTDPLEELSVPDGTQVKEHDLVTDGDVLVGGQSTVELGIRGGTVVAGERVSVEGDIEADGDCRLDMWCEVDGNVLVGNDAYLGERVQISGQLIVSGDLDIGDDVEIEEGFEANGWIVIRNPMPTIVFLFVYLSHLLRIGEKEAAAEVADEFLSEGREAEPVTIPRGAHVSDDTWRVSTPATIGDGCRLHGNIRATEIDVGSDTEVFGSLRAKGSIRVGEGTVIHGDVTTSDGDVVVAPDAYVRGGISCDRCELSEAAEVEGTIRAREGITIEDRPMESAQGEGTDRADSAGASEETSDERSGTEPESSSGPAVEPGVETEGGTESESEAAVESGAETEDDPEPAIVPIANGRLDPTAEASGADHGAGRAFVPLDSDESEPKRAFVPLEESSFKWDAVGERSNGSQEEDVTAIVTDAEEF